MNKKYPIEDLWSVFVETGDSQIRKDIIEFYVPLANRIADWTVTSLPPQVEVDDLRSSAYFGLIDAVERFEPDRGFKFETFATPRIKGAILDFLRGNDWAPRSLRAKGRELLSRTEALTSDLNRDPSIPELATSLGWSEEEVYSVQSRHWRSHLLSLDDGDERPETDAGVDHELPLYHRLADPESIVDDSFSFEPLMATLAASIDGLPTRERIVFTLFYYDDLSLAEIGILFGVTESRVCQILTDAALRCRDSLTLSHQDHRRT